jgi:hypothetical protein
MKGVTMESLNKQEEALSFKTKLIRGASGSYGFEITVYGARTEEESDSMHTKALNAVRKAQNQAEQEFPNKGKG